jgi:DNA-binding NarL/FixJ family response regulator
MVSPRAASLTLAVLALPQPSPLRTDAVALARITPRRAQVLTLIAGHHTNHEIATQLGVAPTTVKRTVDRLRALTCCRSKRELARWWHTHAPAWQAARVLVTREVTTL